MDVLLQGEGGSPPFQEEKHCFLWQSPFAKEQGNVCLEDVQDEYNRMECLLSSSLTKDTRRFLSLCLGKT